MVELTRARERTMEIARIVRKLEQRLKTLLVQAGRVSRRIGSGEASHSRIGVRSPLASPKQLLATLSNKAAPFIHHRKRNPADEEEEEKREQDFSVGLWQREILMGEKCQPLDFSGVIYYDRHGNPLDGIPPRSPRARPLVQSFSFPVPAQVPEKSGY